MHSAGNDKWITQTTWKLSGAISLQPLCLDSDLRQAVVTESRQNLNPHLLIWFWTSGDEFAWCASPWALQRCPPSLHLSPCALPGRRAFLKPAPALSKYFSLLFHSSFFKSFFHLIPHSLLYCESKENELVYTWVIQLLQIVKKEKILCKSKLWFLCNRIKWS